MAAASGSVTFRRCGKSRRKRARPTLSCSNRCPRSAGGRKRATAARAGASSAKIHRLARWFTIRWPKRLKKSHSRSWTWKEKPFASWKHLVRQACTRSTGTWLRRHRVSKEARRAAEVKEAADRAAEVEAVVREAAAEAVSVGGL